MAVGGLIGTIPLAKLSEKFGRRKSFCFSSTITTLGLVCQICSKEAKSYELFALGRFLIGFGTALAMPLEGMYLSEISPVPLRGFFTSFVGIFMQLGFIIGGVLGLSNVLGTWHLWPSLFVMEIPLILVLLFALPFLHESPRFLYSRGAIDECKQSLAYFNRKDLEGDLRELETEIKNQKEQLKLKEIWQKPYLKRAVLLCSCVVLTATFSGITYLEYFSTNILLNVGLSKSVAQYSIVIIFGPSFISALFGSCMIEKVGRRPLLIATTFVLILANISLMVLTIVYNSYGFQWASYATLVVCIVFCFIFGIGPSILQWQITSEMVPQNARSKAQLVVMIVQRIGVIVAIGVFLPLQGSIGPYVFLFYIIPMCIFLVVFIPMFPETKKKTVVEVIEALGYDGESEKKSDVFSLTV